MVNEHSINVKHRHKEENTSSVPKQVDWHPQCTTSSSLRPRSGTCSLSGRLGQRLPIHVEAFVRMYWQPEFCILKGSHMSLPIGIPLPWSFSTTRLLRTSRWVLSWSFLESSSVPVLDGLLGRPAALIHKRSYGELVELEVSACADDLSKAMLAGGSSSVSNQAQLSPGLSIRLLVAQDFFHQNGVPSLKLKRSNCLLTLGWLVQGPVNWSWPGIRTFESSTGNLAGSQAFISFLPRIETALLGFLWFATAMLLWRDVSIDLVKKKTEDMLLLLSLFFS